MDASTLGADRILRMQAGRAEKQRRVVYLSSSSNSSESSEQMSATAVISSSSNNGSKPTWTAQLWHEVLSAIDRCALATIQRVDGGLAIGEELEETKYVEADGRRVAITFHVIAQRAVDRANKDWPYGDMVRWVAHWARDGFAGHLCGDYRGYKWTGDDAAKVVCTVSPL